jgi:sugar-phosphatase
MEAVIFDLDGVLLDSEPFWLIAVRQGLLGVGIDPTPDEYRLTQGMRVDRLVAYWHERYPWEKPTVEVVTAQILDIVLGLIRREGKALPGAQRAVELFAGLGLPLALASSSPMVVIDAALGKLGLSDRFSVIYSAEAEPYGKPHPGVYLSTAARLGVPPQKCLAIEDTVVGLLAAKAAQMACLCVPEADLLGDPRLGIADRVLPSLAVVDAEQAARLVAGDFEADAALSRERPADADHPSLE